MKPFSRKREKVADRPDEGVMGNSACTNECFNRRHPHPNPRSRSGSRVRGQHLACDSEYPAALDVTTQI